MALDPWARQRRQDLLHLLDELHGRIAELTREVEQEAQRRPDVVWLMQEPGAVSSLWRPVQLGGSGSISLLREKWG